MHDRRRFFYSHWADGHEFETEWLQQDGTTVMKRLDTTWTQRALAPGETWYLDGMYTTPAHDPQITQEVTTLLDTNLVSKVTYAYDRYNNKSDTSEYAWGTGAAGSLLKDTQAVYNTGATYIAQSCPADGNGQITQNCHMLNLPITVTTYLGGTQVGLTTNTYDTYTGGATLDAASGIVAHNSYFGTSLQVRGNLTSQQRWLNAGGSSPTTYYSHDIGGNVTRVRDPLVHDTSYGYADGSNTYSHATSRTDALGEGMSWTYDLAIGKPTAFTDVNGAVTHYEYTDPLDRLTKVRRGYGSGIESDTAYTYNSATQVTVQQDKSATGDGLLKTVTLYDGLGRVRETDVYETPTQYIATKKGYDALGRIAWTTNPSRPGDGLDFQTNYSYDPLDRTTQVQTSDTAAVTTSYSGNQTTVTDQAGKRRVTTTDALGRITAVVEDPSGLNYTTSYSYTGLVMGVSQSGRSRTFTNDSLGRLLTALNPESGTIRYTYNGVGSLLTKTDARNVIATYGYDALNRMTSKSYSDGTPAVNYTFDSNSATCTKGHLISVANSSSTTNLTPYDCLGRVTATSQVTSGQTYTFGYGYNLAGALTSETYPSGRGVTTTYDNVSRVQTVVSGATTYLTVPLNALGYWPHGGVKAWSLGNSAAGSQQFNSRLEPTSLAVGTALSLGFYYCPNGGASCSTNNGNLMRQTIASSPPTFSVIQNYDSVPYDGVNRLKSVTEGTLSRSYGYDAWGNRWVSANTGLFLNPFTPTVSTNFSSATNRLGIQGSTYDNAGNQTAIGGFAMGYNGESLMTSSTIGGVATQYGYDGDNRRVKKTTGTATTVYVYDAAGELAAEYAPVTDPDPPCRTCYLLNDHLGSTRAMVDEAQALVARYDYLPFGEQIPTGYDGRTALWGAASAWDGRKTDGLTEKFTSKERDSETGLDYFGARYYSAAQGRFTSPDPANAGASAVSPQTWNGYTYARNNPLRFTDPLGLAASDGRTVPTVDSPFTLDEVPADPETPDHSVRFPDNGAQQQKPNGTTSIQTVSATSSLPGMVLGGLIGEAIDPAGGGVVGAILGSTVGVGGSVSYVPSTDSWFAGATVTFSPVVMSGTGVSANAVIVPSGQNPNSIANGQSYSVTLQPTPLTGTTVVKSPGSGPAVAGPSIGTKVPVAFGASYNFNITPAVNAVRSFVNNAMQTLQSWF